MKPTTTAPKPLARRRVPNGGDNKRITLTLESRLYAAIKIDAEADFRTLAAFVRILLLRHYGMEPTDKEPNHETATPGATPGGDVRH